MPKQAKPRYLFLLRHAKAAVSGKDGADFERPLSDKGEKDALKMAALFVHQGFLPERVLCSPAARTRQTFKALAGNISGLRASYAQELYLIDHDALLARLKTTKADTASVLVVGHNPGIEILALALTNPKQGGDAEGLARMQAKFPTGSLAVLKLCGDGWKSLAAGTCRLEAFVRPKDLE